MNNILQLEHRISLHTKLSSDKRSKLLRWLARQNESIIHLAFQKQKEHYFTLSGVQENDKSILYMSSLYLATAELYNTLQGKQNKNKAINLSTVSDKSSLQAKQFKKKRVSIKYEQLLNIQSKLLFLIDKEGLSYREMSKFFETYHRLKVSHTLIRQVYLDLKKSTNDNT